MFLKKTYKDNLGNYHKIDCKYRNQRFTIIKNATGFKVADQLQTYCFYCGANLRGKRK